VTLFGTIPFVGIADLGLGGLSGLGRVMMASLLGLPDLIGAGREWIPESCS